MTDTRNSRAGRIGWSRRAMVGGLMSGALLHSSAAAARRAPTSSPVPATDRSAWLVDSADLDVAAGRSDSRIVALMRGETFAKGHIPGAVQIDWPALELGTTTDAAIADWTGAMREVVASLGIGPASDVVIYDEGTLFAARLCWLLDYLGHDAQRILDSGFPAWQQLGLPVTRGQGPESGTGASAVADPVPPVRAEALAPLADVRAVIDEGDPEVVLVDARTPEEYAAGHIPGAVNVNYPLNAEPEAPRFWKPADELTALYAGVGVTPGKRIIPYCSTGVRSAVTWFTLRMIGFPDVSLFTGSWAEWSAHLELPVTTGPNP